MNVLLRKAKSAVRLLKNKVKGKGPKTRPIYPKDRAETVFVTGDVGKLGSVVCKKLSEEYNIIGYDINVELSEDVGNVALLKKKMEGAKYVVHLAAIPHPGSGSMGDYLRVNVQGSFNVFKAAEENHIKKFIYISSTAFYGCNIRGKLSPLYLPIDEKHPIASTPGASKGALDEYNQSKVMSEQLCAYFGTNSKFEVITLRSAPANENEIQYPEDFDWKSCNDYRMGAFWSNNPPINVANAIFLALKTDKKFTYEPFNLANKYTDKKIDVKEFLKEEYPDVEVRISLDKNPCLIDTSKIQNILGFKASDCK